MTKEQILKKAISKAVKNGWKIGIWSRKGFYVSPCGYPVFKGYPDDLDIWALIFSHQFAKAFWGDRWVCKNCGKPSTLPFKAKDKDGCDGSKCIRELFKKGEGYRPEPFLKFRQAQNRMIFEWQFHLQQMVISKDPIKYLEKFLED